MIYQLVLGEKSLILKENVQAFMLIYQTYRGKFKDVEKMARKIIKGIIHADLSQDNIFFTRDNFVE